MIRLISLFSAGLMLLFMGGCYDFRGMDAINIVSGIAVDREGDDFLLTLEIVDLSSDSNTSGSETNLVDARGPTIFEAVRSSKLHLYNKLYFGNMHTIIISRQLAEDHGVTELLEVFLRDVEPREDISILVSMEDSARALIEAKGIDTSNICLELRKIIQEDKNVASNTKSMDLYQAYNTLNTPGKELVLPAFHLTGSEGEEIAEVSGIGIFKDDVLTGFLPSADMRFFLLAEDNGAKGALSVPSAQSGDHLLSFEIYDSKHKASLSYENGSLTINTEIDIDLAVTENHPIDETEIPQEDMIKSVEEFLQQRIEEVFTELQKDPGSDIYGYGEMIFEDQYSLWQKIGDDWDQIFKEAQMNVKVNARIINTGLSRKGG